MLIRANEKQNFHGAMGFPNLVILFWTCTMHCRVHCFRRYEDIRCYKMLKSFPSFFFSRHIADHREPVGWESALSKAHWNSLGWWAWWSKNAWPEKDDDWDVVKEWGRSVDQKKSWKENMAVIIWYLIALFISILKWFRDTSWCMYIG